MEKVSKCFSAYRGMLRPLLFSSESRTASKSFDAISQITLSFHKGEHTVIVGHNGSGKSTLLKILSGIYGPTSGVVRRQEHPFYLGSLWQAFKLRLTMRQNIILLSHLLPPSPHSRSRLIQEVVQFADLPGNLDTPLFRWSNGMLSRFSYAFGLWLLRYSQSDFILVDEFVRAGVDDPFLHKWTVAFQEVLSSDKTIVFATPNVLLAREGFDRAILLDRGIVRADGSPKMVLSKYTSMDDDR